MLNENLVAVYRKRGATYPQRGPFHPGVAYPEALWKETADGSNDVYECVRQCLFEAGFDRKRFGTREWSPLSGLVEPGETVLLKPNLVKECHPRDPAGWQYVITHGSLLRALSDYVWKALQGKGVIVVADAPQTDSSFARLRALVQLDSLAAFYRSRGLDFRVHDLRKEEWTNIDGVIACREILRGDPEGYVRFDLGGASEFAGHGGAGRYYGADYCEREVNYHHSGGRQEYLISATAIKADVIFSLPKLKTHKKAGITASLKNLIGINGDKNWLPHHTEGSREEGGDERPERGVGGTAERWVARQLRSATLASPKLGAFLHRKARAAGGAVFGETDAVIRSGNWWGNDTLWRTCLDLNKVLLYGNADGSLREDKPANRKRHYVFVDGIVSGEGSGPMDPDPVCAGVVVLGLNAASVDAACAVLMGFDPERIPIVRQAFQCEHYPIVEGSWRDVRIVSNCDAWNSRLEEVPVEATFHFRPHFAWAGHIERAGAVNLVSAGAGGGR